MKKLVGLLVGLVVLGGCAWFRDPPEQGVAPGATVIYSGSKGSEVFSICDKGNLVYLTRSNPQIAILKDGCNPNVGAPGGPTPLAVGAASERINLPSLPQPFLIQLVPGSAPPMVNPLQGSVESVDPRQPIIIQVQPLPAPECPAAKAAPKTAPKAAPKSCP